MITEGNTNLTARKGVYLCQSVHCHSHHLLLQPDLPATSWTKNEDQRGSRTCPQTHSGYVGQGFHQWASPSRKLSDSLRAESQA